MDIKVINPFVQAGIETMPQMGFTDVKRGNISIKEKTLTSNGITVLVTVSNNIKGSIVYNLTPETGNKLVSKLLAGATSFDEIAQSALCEILNMLTSKVATLWSKEGLKATLSPPRLMINPGETLQVSSDKFVALEMLVDGAPIEFNIACSLN